MPNGGATWSYGSMAGSPEVSMVRYNAVQTAAQPPSTHRQRRVRQRPVGKTNASAMLVP